MINKIWAMPWVTLFFSLAVLAMDGEPNNGGAVVERDDTMIELDLFNSSESAVRKENGVIELEEEVPETRPGPTEVIATNYTDQAATPAPVSADKLLACIFWTGLAAVVIGAIVVVSIPPGDSGSDFNDSFVANPMPWHNFTNQSQLNDTNTTIGNLTDIFHNLTEMFPNQTNFTLPFGSNVNGSFNSTR